MGRTKDSNHGHQDRQMMQWSGPRSELDFHGRLVSTRWQDHYGLGGGMCDLHRQHYQTDP